MGVACGKHSVTVIWALTTEQSNVFYNICYENCECHNMCSMWHSIGGL